MIKNIQNRPKKRGRPTIDPTGEKSVQVGVRLSVDLLSKIIQLVERHNRDFEAMGMPPAATTAILLRMFVEKGVNEAFAKIKAEKEEREAALLHHALHGPKDPTYSGILNAKRKKGKA